MLIDFKGVCKLLSIGQSHFFELRQTGRFPIQPIRLGRCVRYRKEEIEKWVEMGCPVRWRYSK